MGQQPLRILIWYPPGLGVDYHGPSTAIYRLLAAIRRRYSIEATLVHSNPRQIEDAEVLDRTVFIPEPETKSGGVSPLSYIRYLWVSRQWLRAHVHEFDLFFTPNVVKATLGPALIARAMRLPVVGRIAIATSLEDFTRIKHLLGVGRMRRAAIRRLDCIIALSVRIRDRLFAYGFEAEQVRYIPNAVDIGRFRPATGAEKLEARARFGIPADAVVVCCVGAIGERKGQILLVEAARSLPSSLHVLLAGPYRDSSSRIGMEALIKGGDLKARVHCIGHITDVELVFRASDIFCLPSSDEGMPNALIEAMASGLPCIGTQISGIEDLIEEGRGRFVNRSVASIESALTIYKDDPNLREREGEAARRFVFENQSSDRIADETMAVFFETIAARLRA